MNVLKYVEARSKGRSAQFDICRGLALTSVVSAHVSGLFDNNNEISAWFACFHNNLGTIGVPVFLVLAGFFSKSVKVKDLIRKMIYIFVPWLVYGTTVYFYLFFRGQIYNYPAWMLGLNSYLYYLPVYIILTGIFNYIKKRQTVVVLAVFSLIYNVIIEYLPQFGAVYYNVGLWTMWYCIGILLKGNESLWVLLEKIGKYCVLCISVLLILTASFGFSFNAYFEKGYVVFEIIAIIGVFYLSKLMENKMYKTIIFKFCGINSLPFYILHMPLTGIVSRLLYTLHIGIADVLRIPISYLLAFIVVNLIRILIEKTNNVTLIRAAGIK